MENNTISTEIPVSVVKKKNKKKKKTIIEVDLNDANTIKIRSHSNNSSTRKKKKKTQTNPSEDCSNTTFTIETNHMYDIDYNKDMYNENEKKIHKNKKGKKKKILKEKEDSLEYTEPHFGQLQETETETENNINEEPEPHFSRDNLSEKQKLLNHNDAEKIFKQLDSDEDGIITCRKISLAYFEIEFLIAITPILEELQSTKGEMNYNDFCKKFRECCI